MNDLPIKKYIVIGSVALGVSRTKDVDVICYFKDIEVDVSGTNHIRSFYFKGKKIECHLADNQESLRELLEEYYDKPELIHECLYILKAGHIHTAQRNQMLWEKHIHDYHILRKMIKLKIVDKYKMDRLIRLHRKTTNQRVKERTPKLHGVSKEMFFDDSVIKYYEHDDIHKCMAHKRKPMYEYMQLDSTKVECDRSLWDEFSNEEKIQCVLEECYVIALERKVIPSKVSGKVQNHFNAVRWALYRVCTTLCSGWFRQFAIDNYYEILNSINNDYVSVFERRKLELNINEYSNIKTTSKTSKENTRGQVSHGNSI